MKPYCLVMAGVGFCRERVREREGGREGGREERGGMGREGEGGGRGREGGRRFRKVFNLWCVCVCVVRVRACVLYFHVYVGKRTRV